MVAEQNAVIELSADEARSLLEESDFGRIGVVIAGLPEIFPVNYVARDSAITFRTAEGTKLFGLTLNEDVVFEVDEYDEAEAWSVVAKGRARVLQTQAEVDEAEELPLKPWVATLKQNFVRIDIVEVSGRRFLFGAEPEAEPETAS